MSNIEFIVVENGIAAVQYKSGKSIVYGNGRVIPETVYKFCNCAYDKGAMKSEGINRVRFNNWER